MASTSRLLPTPATGTPAVDEKKSGSSQVKSKTYNRQNLGEEWKYHLGIVSDTCHCGINLV